MSRERALRAAGEILDETVAEGRRVARVRVGTLRTLLEAAEVAEQLDRELRTLHSGVRGALRRGSPRVRPARGAR